MDTIDGIRNFRGKFMISGHDDQMINKKRQQNNLLLFLRVHEIDFPIESDN